jgi:hypothetical protein
MRGIRPRASAQLAAGQCHGRDTRDRGEGLVDRDGWGQLTDEPDGARNVASSPRQSGFRGEPTNCVRYRAISSSATSSSPGIDATSASSANSSRSGASMPPRTSALIVEWLKPRAVNIAPVLNNSSTSEIRKLFRQSPTSPILRVLHRCHQTHFALAPSLAETASPGLSPISRCLGRLST